MEGISKGNVNSQIMDFYFQGFFPLNGVSRFFFTEYFYLYNNQNLRKENNTQPCPDSTISVNGIAILEVLKPFGSSWMTLSHRSQSAVDSPFTVLLEVSLPFLLPPPQVRLHHLPLMEFHSTLTQAAR